MQGWLKIKQACKYCNMSERTLRSWLKSGLKHTRLPSGTILIKTTWIDEYLESYEVQENKVDEMVDELMRGVCNEKR